MSTPESIASELQKLSPDAIIELFVLDATSIGGEIFRFHAGTNELRQNIVWQGETYIRFPVQVNGFELSGQGTLPRPRMRVSNVLSTITALLIQYEDLVGSKIIRKRTMKKYLDAENFEGGVNPTEDTAASFADDIYFIDRKSSENRDMVEFELASSLDLHGVKIPRRQIIANLCPWVYKSAECGYTDTRYFTIDDVETTDSTQDRCGKRLKSCKCRFGSGGALPFGGFPSVGNSR